MSQPHVTFSRPISRHPELCQGENAMLVNSYGHGFRIKVCQNASRLDFHHVFWKVTSVLRYEMVNEGGVEMKTKVSLRARWKTVLKAIGSV